MAPRHVAVIDIGKTNAKVALVDLATLSEVAVRRKPNRVLRDGFYAHYDVEGLWAFVLESLAAINAETPIEAISVTTHGASAALLTADGSLALPVLDYEDHGPEETAKEYGRLRPDFAETGSPRLPVGLNLGAQLFWLQERFPDRFATARTILTYPQYWSYRLTGVAANEVTSLGSHTDLWNPSQRSYSSLVERMGWRGRMAPLRKAGDVLGRILPKVAEQTGIDRTCPVACGIHDSNASLLPHLMREERPFAVVSTGTWVIAMAVGGSETRLDPARDTLINVDAFGEPVRSARFMGGREHAELLGEDVVSYGADDIETVLRGRAMLLPSVERGTGPFPLHATRWTVAPEALSSGERAAVVSCYLALMTATCLEMIGAAGPTLVEGAFTRDPILLDFIAALTGRPVRGEAARTTGTSIGAAILLGGTMPSAEEPPPRSEALAGLSDLIGAYAQDWAREVDAAPFAV